MNLLKNLVHRMMFNKKIMNSKNSTYVKHYKKMPLYLTLTLEELQVALKKNKDIHSIVNFTVTS